MKPVNRGYARLFPDQEESKRQQDVQLASNRYTYRSAQLFIQSLIRNKQLKNRPEDSAKTAQAKKDSKWKPFMVESRFANEHFLLQTTSTTTLRSCFLRVCSRHSNLTSQNRRHLLTNWATSHYICTITTNIPFKTGERSGSRNSFGSI